MASCLARLARTCVLHRTPISSTSSHRLFSASSPVLARRVKPEERLNADQAFDLLEDDFDEDDTSTAGHLMLREQRRVLYYLRLIEHEMPKLVAYRKPYTPPTAETPLVVRSLDYAGEEHPATAKRVIVVAVDELPLRSASAIHKLQLLAGPRWTPNPPADAGVQKDVPWGNGYVKISCEDFATPAMNLKWASDTLDRLILEANSNPGTFKDVPLDLRHLRSKIEKAKRGDHLRGRLFHRPSIADFPKAWLPNDSKHY
ncbi:hypothetical protein E4T56_gene14103 [Termitomyces sp. T112]|nr:hypothetical protein C0989_005353 [Termitomyces sp. Mn162]KAG5727871.1 hypothetical protein E4T56_gene14103 [Termitomyces sp. T112]KAH0590838.1 hypothetical protein H2248_000958 [Termitomyces sp. 'cryptogamus']KNZ78523.1 37S ribosomal protein S24, mitochondrial [Termitomyces sp. J132]